MWKEHYHPPEDPEEHRAVWKTVASHFIETGLLIATHLGDYAVGMVAVEAAIEGQEITAEYVAARLHGYVSDDTARRRVKEMARKGILVSRKVGRACLYSLRPGLCETVMNLIEGNLDPGKFNDNRNLRALQDCNAPAPASLETDTA